MSTPQQAGGPSPYAFTINGKVLFDPFPEQIAFTESQEPNVFLWGNRGGGKSITARMFAHGMAMAHKNFRYIIVRRSFPELTKNHLIYLNEEMSLFGGSYNKTEHICYYKDTNSIGFYAQCASQEDIKKIVGAEAALVIFDEAPELEWDWMRLIAASVRVTKDSGLKPMVRYLGNPIGPSIDKLFSYFQIDGEAPPDPSDDPEYFAQDWKAIEIRLENNPHIDHEVYRKQFAGIPAHFRQAWLAGKRVVEGAYFFIDPEKHHTQKYPDLSGALIYRAMDWGVHDHAVCLWIASYPNGRCLVFRERSWTHTPAVEVARQINEDTKAMGLRVTTTFCDPTMLPAEGSDSILSGTILERNGIPLTKSRNDRVAAGYAITEYLNTQLNDGAKLQIYTPNCPMLTKTLPQMRYDAKNPGKLADGNDHWVISLAYFCMSNVTTPRTPAVNPQHDQFTQRILELQRLSRVPTVKTPWYKRAR